MPTRSYNPFMPNTQIVLPSAGLQPFESDQAAVDLTPVLAHWREVERMELHEDSLSMPYEIVYASALGLPSEDGQIPWAAYETHTLHAGCAWVYPCHLDAGMTDMVLQPVDELRLTEVEARMLYTLLAPLFEQHGMALRYHSAERWLAVSPQFDDYRCVSLARAQGRSIQDFLPEAGTDPKQLRIAQLQAEAQMLLYAHPLSEERPARGLPAVNSLWIDGAGRLDTRPEPHGQVKLDQRLLAARQSESSYISAWHELLAEYAQQAQLALSQGQKFGLSLCGDRAAISLWAEKPSWKAKFSSIFGSRPLKNLREVL